jgi:hypothetical protein
MALPSEEIVMEGHDVVTLNRDELYDLVWSRSMSQLCREYGISAVGLAKICRKHQVPYPPRGYWAKVRNGRKVRKPALQPTRDPDPQRIQIHRRTLPNGDGAAREEAPNRAAAGKRQEERIRVAEALTDPHPLVERTVRSLNSARPGPDGLVAPKAARCLDVKVGPNSVDRAARLLDAMIKALEARGYAVSAGEGEPPKTWVALLGERVSLRLEEAVERQEKVQSFFNHRHEYDHVPTGRLTLRIDALGWGYRRQWSDGKKSLDGRLNAVVAGLVAAAEASRAVREANEQRERERKEEERRRQESERRRREEEARLLDFERKLASWEQAERIRAFAAAVRDDAVRRMEVIPPGGELDRWLAWAFRRADRLDPLTAVRAEDRWPPPDGLKVRASDQRGYGWPSSDYGGTPIVTPDAIPSTEGSGPAAAPSDG